MAELGDLCKGTALDELLPRVVQFARTRVGLERVGLYLRCQQRERIVLRGTWGTGAHGEATDEHGFWHEITKEHSGALQSLHASGFCGLYRDGVPHVAKEGDELVIIGSGWVVETPLMTANELVGVMYNDTALGRRPVEEDKQASIAVLCSLLATVVARSGAAVLQPLPLHAAVSSLVRRALDLLHLNPSIRGERLASQLQVSPGHLARRFRSEVGVSMVDYRNRLRLDRFSACIERGSSSLLDAALAAGFGSYAQFHRVHRKLLGVAPHEVLLTPRPSQGL